MKVETIIDKLHEHVYGQLEAKTALASAAHLWMLQMHKVGKATLYSNVLLTGPSGSGKTLLARTLARSLVLPYFEFDSSKLTPEGYIGTNFSDFKRQLVSKMKAKSVFEIRGIVFLDEIDKLTSARGDRDGFKSQVQGQMLKFIENTPNILWILGGNYSEIRKTRKTIGIGKKLEENIHEGSTFEQLENIGVSSQLLGRVRYCAALDVFTEEDYINILKEPKYIMAPYLELSNKLDTKFKLTEKQVKDIAVKCTKGDTGARKLSQEVNLLFSESVKDIVAFEPKVPAESITAAVGLEYDNIIDTRKMKMKTREDLVDALNMAEEKCALYKDRIKKHKADIVKYKTLHTQRYLDDLAKLEGHEMAVYKRKTEWVHSMGLIDTIKWWFKENDSQEL